MSKRLTHEFVSSKLAEEKYQLLSRYQDSRIKLDLICPKNHAFSKTWKSFEQGRRCPYCFGNKTSHKQVKAAFEKEGYKLLSDYSHTDRLLDFICPQNHSHSIRWSDFSRGVRCGYCAGKKMCHQIVKDKFEAEGYKLLSQYESSKKRLNYICQKGHSHSMSWINFQQGSRCAYCAKKRVSPEQVKNAFQEEGYTLLSRYENSKTKLDFICAQGHIFSIRWGEFAAGHRCSYCAGQIVTHKQVEEAFKREGYTLLSQYRNNKSKLKFICPKDHHHSITWNAFNRGDRCVNCASFGYRLSKPGRLYYLYFPGLQLYKIGITNRLVSERFKAERNQYVVLLDEYYEDGTIPAKKEAQILSKFANKKYNGPNVIYAGNSELFVSDVLELNLYAKS